MGPITRLKQFSVDLSTPALMGGELYVSRSGVIFSFGRTQSDAKKVNILRSEGELLGERLRDQF